MSTASDANTSMAYSTDLNQDTAYPYPELNARRAEIRLLHLARGLQTDPIACHLETVSLVDNPSYQAVSYAWGSTADPVTISLGSEPFKITRGLHAALLRFRLPDRTRVIWVDAVCINQHDIAERSSQVALMPCIYAWAKNVLIWLGDSLTRAFDDDDRALWWRRAWIVPEYVLATGE